MTEEEDRAIIARLQHEALLRSRIEEERVRSDALYAQKIVERVVFGGIGLLAIAVVGALLSLVLK